MKKPIVPIILIICGIVAGFLAAGAIYLFTGFSIFGGTQENETKTGDLKNAEFIKLAYTVLGYIKDNDFTALASVTHPEFGVVFSPYATINLSTDKRLSAQQIATLDSDTGQYVWGVYDSTGEPINLTPAEYIEEFIPAATHMAAAVIGINQIVKSGNALENMTDVFPNVKFIDFHVPGGDNTDDINWSSLRLGFEEYDGTFMLIVIAYSTWTI